MDGAAPPPYSEVDPSIAGSQSDDVNSRNVPRGEFSVSRKPVSNITRKPVARPAPSSSIAGSQYFPSEKNEIPQATSADNNVGRIGMDGSVRNAPVQPPTRLVTSMQQLNIHEGEEFPGPTHINTSVSEPLTSTSSASSFRNPLSATLSSSSLSSFASKTSSFSQKAFKETRHFAGGLIHHPSESTKHFSILRHSHGLVFYQGVMTSLAVSIFSDAPLPADRTIWLQCKGYSGNTGMRLKSLMRIDGSWINVTPATQVNVGQLSASDERAWQRDIKSFLKRSDRRIKENHRLRETAIVRIPAEAEDGYFRLMLCSGGAQNAERKRVLCPSPVFRILSTTASPGVVKGASLGSLPLEIGAKIASSIARSTVSTAAAPYTAAAQNAVAPLMPSAWATAAYDLTAADKVDAQVEDIETQYDQRRALEFAEIADAEGITDQGPRSPYPIAFNAKMGPGSQIDSNDLGVPSITLTSVPESVIRQLNGHYFGWLRVKGNKGKARAENDLADGEWAQVVLSSLSVDHTQLGRVKVSHAGERKLSVHVLQQFSLPQVERQALEIRILGFLRPQQHLPSSSMSPEEVENFADESLIQAVNNLDIAQAWLDRPAWGPHARCIQDGDDDNNGPTYLGRVKTGLVEGRVAAQRHADKVALHRAGVRIATDDLRSKAIGTGGLYVVR